MPMMVCADCEKQHSDAAPACPHCGRPHMVAPVVATVPLPQGRYPQAPVGPRLACPACGSPDVKKLSFVYREGTTITQTNAGGAILGTGEGAVLGARVSGTRTSLLAMGAAPPMPKSNAEAWFVAALGAIVLLSAVNMAQPALIIVGCIALAIAGTLAMNNNKWNKEDFPQLSERWEATFLCTRCENRFVP